MKAIPTKVDGILFRSKLEAHWYECFKRIGLSVTYEPESFMFENRFGEAIFYSPDFLLEYGDASSYFVEVKPIKARYIDHDSKSIHSICMMGYNAPSILIIGSPFRFGGCVIEERHKGNPSGFEIGDNFEFERMNSWCANGFYPDEEPIDDPIPLDRLELSSFTQSIWMAPEAWNSIRWK